MDVVCIQEYISARGERMHKGDLEAGVMRVSHPIPYTWVLEHTIHSFAMTAGLERRDSEIF